MKMQVSGKRARNMKTMFTMLIVDVQEGDVMSANQGALARSFADKSNEQIDVVDAEKRLSHFIIP